MIRATIDCAVVAEPDIRFSKSGKAWAMIRCVSVERKKDQNGQWVDGDKTWFTVLTFGKPAEMIADSDIPKGTRLLVSGNLKEEEYTTDSGETRKALKVYADQVALEMRFAPYRPISSSGTATQAAAQAQDESPF